MNGIEQLLESKVVPVTASRFSPLVVPPHEDPVFPEIYTPLNRFSFSVA